jgi:glyoxylase-like metal-dependent hydrolase (beta-lactamase superfamily II)
VGWYAAGDRLQAGVEAYTGREHNDLARWIESVRAVVVGDSLAVFGTGLALNPWPRPGVTREQAAERLRPLLALPVEIVLPAHGEPTDRAALARALAPSGGGESQLVSTEHGLVPKGQGWFVLNARDAQWWERGGRGILCEFEGAGLLPE